ncbi:hypothetical protein [Sulfodiicoccus acidiphilus]|nr:hypothetical protein [Sulfodiicoccus acidiphilus]
MRARSLSKSNVVLIVLVVASVVGTGYFVATGLAPSNSSLGVLNATEGYFYVPLFNYNDGSLTYQRLFGVKMTVNNIDEKSLTIVSISNSTFSVNYPSYYEYQQVMAPNGSLVYAYARTYEIYLGVNTVIIPLKLSPGTYTVLFNDGNSIQIQVSPT